MSKVPNNEQLLTEACLLLARHHFGCDVALEVHRRGAIFGARLSSGVPEGDNARELVAAFGDAQREALCNLLVVLRNYRTP